MKGNRIVNWVFGYSLFNNGKFVWDLFRILITGLRASTYNTFWQLETTTTSAHHHVLCETCYSQQPNNSRSRGASTEKGFRLSTWTAESHIQKGLKNLDSCQCHHGGSHSRRAFANRLYVVEQKSTFTNISCANVFIFIPWWVTTPQFLYIDDAIPK